MPIITAPRRRLGLAALSAAAVAAALAGPAAGVAPAATFGSQLKETPQQSDTGSQCSPIPGQPCTRVGVRSNSQGSNVLLNSPVDGVVTGFSIRSATPDTVTFRVVRMSLAGMPEQALALGIGSGPTVILKGTKAVESFPARIPGVQKGDDVGLDATITNAQYGNNGNTKQYVFQSPLANGGGLRSAADGANDELLVQATIELDADRDGFGDASQDGCPSQAGTAGPCMAASPDKPGQTVDLSKPVISKQKVAPFRFVNTANAKVTFSLSEKAMVRVALQRLVRGRFVTLKVFGTVSGAKGSNLAAFQMRKRPAGSYRLLLKARDSAGNVSVEKRASFRVIPKLKVKRIG